MADKFAAAVADMAAELAAEPGWQPYTEFLQLRGDRAHEAAQQAAERFAETARHWPYEERKRFGLWLMDRAGRVMERIGSARNSRRGRTFISPLVMVETVLLPTLREWREREPSNPEPHFWAGLYPPLSSGPDSHPATRLKEAIRLDPGHAPAREALARHILDAVRYNQHELPSGYLRNAPEDDLASLQEVEELLAEPVDPDTRSTLQEHVAALRRTVEVWIETRRKRAAEASRWLEADARCGLPLGNLPQQGLRDRLSS